MPLPRFGVIALSLLALCVGARASKVATLNSGYGFSDFGPNNDQTPTSTCIELESISCFLTEQTFYPTGASTPAIYDFKINNDIFNFTLQLVGNAAADYGWFIQDTANPGPVQYGPDPTAFVTSSELINGDTGAQITVSGDGKGYVFYLVLDKTSIGDTPPNPTDVTASIVPEPHLLPILAFAPLAIMLLRRRCRARSI